MNRKQFEVEQEDLISFESGTLSEKSSNPIPVQPYDNKYIYNHDILRAYRKTDLNSLISKAEKQMKNAPDMTYVIITDQGRCLFLDVGTQLCPTTTFSYSPEKVLYSIAKIDGRIIPGFITPSEEIEEYMYSQSLS